MDSRKKTNVDRRRGALGRLLVFSWVALATVSAPKLAEACAVCFGDPNAPQRVGASYAVLALMFVVVAVLACFALFFLHLKKRAGLFDADAAHSHDF